MAAKASQQSAQEWLEMMTSKFKRYPNFKDMKDELSEEIKGLAREFGRGKTQAGIEACIKDPSRDDVSFMPAPGVTRFYVMKAPDPNAPKLKAAESGCDRCHGDGWYRTELAGRDLDRAIILYGEDLARRQYRMAPCECRRTA